MGYIMSVIAVILVTLVPLLWAIRDLIKAEFKDPKQKWVVGAVLFITPILGAVLYILFRKFFVVRNENF